MDRTQKTFKVHVMMMSKRFDPYKRGHENKITKSLKVEEAIIPKEREKNRKEAFGPITHQFATLRLLISLVIAGMQLELLAIPPFF